MRPTHSASPAASSPSAESGRAASPDAFGPALRAAVLTAMLLSMGAAISLGITRFSYALLLPVMRADLGWGYTLAGAMNTMNAGGYLLGALVTPRLMRRFGAPRLLMIGALAAALFMGLSGFFVQATPLLVQRLLAGIASAWIFIAGGVLAAQLGALRPQHAGLLLGLYYGGTGWGIVASALAVPPLLAAAHEVPHGWSWAWWGLSLLCVVAAMLMGLALRRLTPGAPEHRATGESAADVGAAPGAHAPVTPATPVRSTDNTAARAGRVAPMAWALAGYACFGIGYIGYMTFVIALLRERGASGAAVTLFYALLGLAVVASARLWAGLLDRARGGGAIALLNALLAVATVLPTVSGSWGIALVSGLLFGAVFLSVVASTTAFVRHNLPTSEWPAGISAFTIIFAAGQIVGPSIVGWIADGSGGLSRGLQLSAFVLLLGSLLAWRQRPLRQE